MLYQSTRGGIEPVPFQEAVMMGLADDGGLLIPESIPHAAAEMETWGTLSYTELAYEIMRRFIGDIPEADLKKLIDQSYIGAFPEGVAPLQTIGPVHILELFHGPTLAFKDMALQFLGNLFSYILAQTGSRLNVLAATSGDTGSAAIYGVRGREGIHIFVMHPHNRVSSVQKLQMTTVLDTNVHNIAIEGTFDDAQKIMKAIASDLNFKREYSLGAVNSVNWARVLAQIVYYVYASLQIQKNTGSEAVRFCVPTGNFGNILAGWYAVQMGAPISKLILATNRNDILSRFFHTGEYSLSTVSQTISPSMDIQVASNFERYLYYKLGADASVLKEKMNIFARSGSLIAPMESDGVTDSLFCAGSADEEKTCATIAKYFTQYQYVLDPHTAVGVAVAEENNPEESPIICLATAHPAKFLEAVSKATGESNIGRHPSIDALDGLESRCKVLPAEEGAIRNYITETLRSADHAGD